MERDFMGLAVKQEAADEPIDAAPLRSTAMHWSYPNKASVIPQLLSFHGVQENQRPKTGFDALASTGLVTITTQKPFDTNNNPYSGVLQKHVGPEKQSGLHHTMTTYPTKHFDAHAIHRPVTTQTNLTVLPAVHRPFVSSGGHNMIGSISAQPLSAVPMANHVPAVPSNSPVVGSTDLRNASKISGASTQLTIFYNGAVCVYDNISPEKAQAILLLAGNGPPLTSSPAVPSTPVQASMPKSSVFDAFFVSQPYGMTISRASPTAITSISVSHSAANWAGSINATSASNQGGVIVTSQKFEPPKLVNLPGSVAANYTTPGTVPQFRRKSLARFLEKRKERVINTSPYDNKQSAEGSTPGAGSTSLSPKSSGSRAI